MKRKFKKTTSIFLILLFIMQIFQRYSVIAATEISSAKILSGEDMRSSFAKMDRR